MYFSAECLTDNRRCIIEAFSFCKGERESIRGTDRRDSATRVHWIFWQRYFRAENVRIRSAVIRIRNRRRREKCIDNGFKSPRRAAGVMGLFANYDPPGIHTHICRMGTEIIREKCPIGLLNERHASSRYFGCRRFYIVAREYRSLRKTLSAKYFMHWSCSLESLNRFFGAAADIHVFHEHGLRHGTPSFIRPAFYNKKRAVRVPKIHVRFTVSKRHTTGSVVHCREYLCIIFPSYANANFVRQWRLNAVLAVKYRTQFSELMRRKRSIGWRGGLQPGKHVSLDT